MRPMLLQRILCLFVISWLLIVADVVVAEPEEHVFAEYLQYLMEQEGYNLTEAIKEMQSLQQGKEALIQSYLKTEQDLENLDKAALLTQQSQLDYYEKRYPQAELTEWETPSEDFRSDVSTTDEYPEDKLWSRVAAVSDINEADIQAPNPPRFRLVGIVEYTDEGAPALDITLRNSGAEGDLSVALMTKDGVLISQPFYRELNAFSGTSVLSFQLLQQPQQITIQLESDGGTLGIPVFLRNANQQPVVINAAPFETECQMGESVEYHLTLEGAPNNPCRYNVTVAQLPAGIVSEILQSQTLYSVTSIKFSPAFKRHELILRITVTSDLPEDLMSKPIPFLFSLCTVGKKDNISETLSLTPIGVGRISIDRPETPLSLALGEEKTFSLAITNIGSQDIDALEMFPDRTVMGLRITAPQQISLKIGERKEVKLRVEANNSAHIGHHNVTFYASVPQEKIREKTTIPVRVTARPLNFSLSSFSMRTVLKPLLPVFGVAVFGCVIGIFWGKRKKLVDESALSDD